MKFLVFVISLVVLGCARESSSFAADPTTISLEGKDRIVNVNTGEFEMVLVLGQRGFNVNTAKGGQGKGKGPPQPPVNTSCSDTDLNRSFVTIGPVLPLDTFLVEYHPLFEPDTLAFEALDRAFTTWETAIEDPTLIEFTYILGGGATVERDGINVIGWRKFVGPDSNFLAAAWIWDDGDQVLEVDVFFNLKHKWTVSAAIEPGSSLCGDEFDIQAIGTHEIGHLIGLDHVEDDGNDANGDERDATMAPSAGAGELSKQTVTVGDIEGAGVVTAIE